MISVMPRLGGPWPLLVVYAILAGIFLMATPPLEGPDEAWHLGFITELERKGGLPVAQPKKPGLARQEATQSPIYYILSALFTPGECLEKTEEIYRWRRNNPAGRADFPGYKHIWLYSEHKGEHHPAAAALLRIRWFSVFLGGITIFATWLLSVELGPKRTHTPLLAAGLVALNPMFIFMSSSVNNDALVMPLSTLTLLALCKALKQPGWFWAAGILMGLGIMSKVSALSLFLPCAIAVFFGASSLKARLRRALAILIPVLIISGWWFARNLILYGQLTASEVHRKIAGNARAALEPLALFKEWDSFVKSYWGVFGGFNIIYPDWVYYVFYGLSAFFVLAACRLYFRRDISKPPLGILTGQALANLAAVAVWTSFLWGSQGRLIFPSVGGLACLAAWEQDHWPRPWGLVFTVITLGFLAGVSLWAGLSIIPASYP